MLAGDALGNDKVICVVAGGVDGAARGGPWPPSRARYRQRYEHAAPDLCAVCLRRRDGVRRRPCRQANRPTRRKFLPALAAIHYQGITGDIAFDAEGRLARMPR